MSFWERRDVFRVGGGYALVAWLIQPALAAVFARIRGG
jgi:hypothetical protein